MKVRGILIKNRDLGKIMFSVLRLKDYEIQIVVTEPEKANILSELKPGSVIDVFGELESGEKNNFKYKFEILNPHIEVVVDNKNVPPVDYFKDDPEAKLEFQLDHRSVFLRTKRAINICNAVSDATCLYFSYMSNDVGAKYFLPPHFSNMGTEGGAELFVLDYFENRACLTQSSQMFKQIMAGSLLKVFSISPCFRADPSETTRHLAEANQLEFETMILDDWSEIIDVFILFLKKVSKELNKYSSFFENYLLFDGSHTRIKFFDAKDILKKNNVHGHNDLDFCSDEERFICDFFKKEKNHDVVVITHWPIEARPFYSFPNPDGTSNTFDVLFRGIELCSGGQRIHDIDQFEKSILNNNLDIESMGTYLSAFKYGMPPHGGFGAGLERIIMTILGLKNIREVVPFPSDKKMVASERFSRHAVLDSITKISEAHYVECE